MFARIDRNSVTALSPRKAERHRQSLHFTIAMLIYSSLRVSPFCVPIFADVSMCTRNFHLFYRGKPWSINVNVKRVRVFSVYYLWVVYIV